MAYRPIGTVAHSEVGANMAVMQPNENQDSFLARADAAMYEAKRLGRNRVEVDRPVAAGDGLLKS